MANPLALAALDQAAQLREMLSGVDPQVLAEALKGLKGLKGLNAAA